MMATDSILSSAQNASLLPTEMWREVFSFFDLQQLSRLQEVCKLFRNIVQSSGAEVTINFTATYGVFVTINDKLQGFVMTRADVVGPLKLHHPLEAGDKVRVAPPRHKQATSIPFMRLI